MSHERSHLMRLTVEVPKNVPAAAIIAALEALGVRTLDDPDHPLTAPSPALEYVLSLERGLVLAVTRLSLEEFFESEGDPPEEATKNTALLDDSLQTHLFARHSRSVGRDSLPMCDCPLQAINGVNLFLASRRLGSTGMLGYDPSSLVSLEQLGCKKITQTFEKPRAFGAKRFGLLQKVCREIMPHCSS